MLYLGAIGSLTYFATVLREMSNSLEIQRMLFPSCRCSLRRKDQSSAFSIKTSLALGPFSGHGTIIGLSVKWPPFRLAVSKKRPTFRLAKTAHTSTAADLAGCSSPGTSARHRYRDGPARQ